MLEPQIEHQRVFMHATGHHRELRNEAIFVFDLQRKLGQVQRLDGPSEDTCQLAGSQPVMRVVRHPSLQTAEGSLAQGGAAIEEPAVHPANLGDVGMRRNHAAIREDENNAGSRMLVEESVEFSNVHRN